MEPDALQQTAICSFDEIKRFPIFEKPIIKLENGVVVTIEGVEVVVG